MDDEFLLFYTIYFITPVNNFRSDQLSVIASLVSWNLSDVVTVVKLGLEGIHSENILFSSLKARN